MKKSIFAVCDLEAAYACNLTDYLNEKRITPFEVQAFTNAESLISFAKDHTIEILLISTRAMCEEIKELSVSRIIILSEGEPLQNLDEYPFVYKYQASDNLVAEVMEYYTAGNPEICLQPKQTRPTKIYGIYSPLHRIGKTSFALTLGEILAEKKRVLYLNLEEYSGFEEMMDQHYRMDLSDLIYFAREREGTMIYKLNAMVQTFHELQYIPPAVSPVDLRDVSADEWIWMLQEIMTYCEYEVIILDLGDQINDLLRILNRCDQIFMPVAEDWISETKLRQFQKVLSLYEYGKLEQKIQKLCLPRQNIDPEEKDRIRQLVWGQMGDYVRRLLSETEGWEERSE